MEFFLFVRIVKFFIVGRVFSLGGVFFKCKMRCCFGLVFWWLCFWMYFWEESWEIRGLDSRRGGEGGSSFSSVFF